LRIITNVLAVVGGLALIAILFMALSQHEIDRSNILPPGLVPATPPKGKAAPRASGSTVTPPAPVLLRNALQGMLRDLLPPTGEETALPVPQSAGAQLLKQYCAQCHSPPAPGLHTADQWPGVVARMSWRAQLLRGQMGVRPLPAAATAQITAYLQQHALQPIDPSRYNDLSQPDGQAYLATCGQCHAPPDPGLHQATEWPSIANRMRTYAAPMAKQLPNAATWQQALAYLARHGR
jgi:cytochrome c553